MKPSIRIIFFTILILSTFVFAGCPVVKKKELPPPPEPVMEAPSEPAAVIMEVAPPEPEPEPKDY